MGEFEEFLEPLYEDKAALINSVILMSIVTLGIFTIYSIDYKLAYVIINIFYVLITFSVILITLSTREIYKEEFFQLFIYSYVFLITISIIAFLSIDIQIIEKLELDNILCFEESAFVPLTYNLLLLIPISYLSKHRKEIRDIKGILILVLILILIFHFIEHYKTIMVLMNLFISLFNLYLIRNYKTVKEKRVNYIKICLMLFLGNSVVEIFTLFDSENLTYVYISAGLFIMGVGLLIGGVINKLINDPYKILFKSLYDENVKLNKINKEIIKSNERLEKSQIIVRRKERMFQMFLSEIPMPIIIINKKNNRIIFANKSFLALFELSSIKEVVNKKVNNIIHINKGNFSNEEDILYEGTTEINGEIKHFEIEVIDSKEGESQEILLVYDSTEKLNIEGMKEKINKELLEEKIKREFLSNITHDLKTPINVIFSAMQVEKYLIENEKIDEMNKYNFVSKQNCKSLIGLTNNLIDSSKMGSNYMTPRLNKINVVEVIENNIGALVDYASMQNIDIIFDTNREIVYSNLDQEFMNRIITNLLSNSIKFTDENGVINVSIEVRGDKVKLEIKDNGVGMDKFFLKVAFERYSMQREEGNTVTGTGIGLFVVRKFVELMNGKIIINSEIGVGTQIQMYFDLYDSVEEKVYADIN